MQEIIISPQLAISTPFVSYNDGVRCQMAASQCRQAVPLISNEAPIVETTLERSHIIEPDIIRAKDDCEVIFSSYHLIVTKNTEGKYDVHKVSYLYKIPKRGTKFKQGDVITYKQGYFDDEGNLAQGKNLLCAIITDPWTYEDSIFLDESVDLTSYKYHVIERKISVSHVLLSLDNKKYKIVPEIGEKIKAFSPLLRIKQNNPTRVLQDPDEVYLNEDVEIIDVELVANRWNTEIREYETEILDFLQRKEKLADWVEKNIEDPYVINQIKKYHNLFEYSKFTQSTNKKIHNVTHGKEAFDLYIRIVCRSLRKIETGDKISNRHANKGVMSKIGKLPKLKDGRQIQVITDLMSIPSRMNIGQLYEAIASNCLYYLKKNLQEFQDLKKAKEYINNFYKIIDNTNDKFIISQCKEQLDTIDSLEELKNIELSFPAPPFESSTRDQILEACYYINPELKKNITAYFTQDKFDKLPDLHPLLEIVQRDGNEFYATCGYIYFYKLTHMSREKIAARGTGKIHKKTMQPTSGRKNQGGQRFGEMEIWCLLAYGALINLSEVIRLKSDDIQQKVNFLLKKLYDNNLMIKDSEIETVKLLKSYLKVLRVELKE